MTVEQLITCGMLGGSLAAPLTLGVSPNHLFSVDTSPFAARKPRLLLRMFLVTSHHIRRITKKTDGVKMQFYARTPTVWGHRCNHRGDAPTRRIILTVWQFSPQIPEHNHARSSASSETGFLGERKGLREEDHEEGFLPSPILPTGRPSLQGDHVCPRAPLQAGPGLPAACTAGLSRSLTSGRRGGVNATPAALRWAGTGLAGGEKGCFPRAPGQAPPGCWSRNCFSAPLTWVPSASTASGP